MVNIFVGGFGSGKSEVAVNFAISLVKKGFRVKIGDLDIVNPYFRSREARGVLGEYGVEMLFPPVEIMESDLPLIRPEIRGALKNPDGFVVLDFGGNAVGARVLASLSGIISDALFNCFFVLNSRRPFNKTAAEVKKTIHSIEEMGRIKVTHLVANSHLIEETTHDVIEEGIALAEAVAKETEKEIGFVAVEHRVLLEYSFEHIPYPILALNRQLLKPWETKEELGSQKFKL
ncbi:MAG: cobalamin biosynthesis protein CobQ [bacterium]